MVVCPRFSLPECPLRIASGWLEVALLLCVRFFTFESFLFSEESRDGRAFGMGIAGARGSSRARGVCRISSGGPARLQAGTAGLRHDPQLWLRIGRCPQALGRRLPQD